MVRETVMLAAIGQEQFLELKQRHFELISPYPLINAVVSGLQRGFVYADHGYESFFICTKFGFSLFNAPDDAAFNQYFLEFLLQKKDIPEYIHLYRLNRSFQNYLEANWPKFRVRRRAQFRNFNKDQIRDHEDLLSAGYQIAVVHEVDFERLERILGLDLGQRYWNSKEDFLSKAIGACIVDESGEPVAICYSACTVDGIAEVDILVSPEHRGKKLMKIVCARCLNQILNQKLIAHWDAFIANTPSYMMAQKLGMTTIQEYDLLSLFLR